MVQQTNFDLCKDTKYPVYVSRSANIKAGFDIRNERGFAAFGEAIEELGATALATPYDGWFVVTGPERAKLSSALSLPGRKLKGRNIFLLMGKRTKLGLD